LKPASGPLVIVCGGGAFPAAVADAVRKRGRDFLLFAIRGFADPKIVERYPHEWIHLGQIGRLERLVQRHQAREATFVGTVFRPRLRDIRIDWRTLRYLPRYLRMQRGGDNRLLSFIARETEAGGVRVLGAHEVAPEILVPAGVLGRHRPSRASAAEIALGRAVIGALGPFDVGQAVVVVNRRVVAIEGAEGTAAMLERVAAIRRSGRLHAGARAGVLVKAPKPGQELRLDLPAIGADTIAQAAAAGLSGVAAEAGGSIVADANALVQAADAAGLFVLGFESGLEAPS
jgi:DUF1009 family protein